MFNAPEQHAEEIVSPSPTEREPDDFELPQEFVRLRTILQEEYKRLSPREEYLESLSQSKLTLPQTKNAPEIQVPRTPHRNKIKHGFEPSFLNTDILSRAGITDYQPEELVKHSCTETILRDRACFGERSPFEGIACSHDENTSGAIAHNQNYIGGDHVELRYYLHPENPECLEVSSTIGDSKGHGIAAHPWSILAKRFFQAFHEQIPNQPVAAMSAFEKFYESLPFSPVDENEYSYSHVSFSEKEGFSEVIFLQAGSGGLLILEEKTPGHFHISAIAGENIGPNTERFHFIARDLPFEQRPFSHLLIGAGGDINEIVPYKASYNYPVRVFHISDGILAAKLREKSDTDSSDVYEAGDILGKRIDKILVNNEGAPIDMVAEKILENLNEIHFGPEFQQSDDVTIAVLWPKSNLATPRS